MNPNDPYAKLGGGALDQELFKKKPTLPVSPVLETDTLLAEDEQSSSLMRF
jgi:hypothetical protein